MVPTRKDKSCGQCGTIFSGSNPSVRLRRHMEAVHPKNRPPTPPESLPCDSCDKLFKGKNPKKSLARHKKTQHTPRVCAVEKGKWLPASQSGLCKALTGSKTEDCSGLGIDFPSFAPGATDAHLMPELESSPLELLDLDWDLMDEAPPFFLHDDSWMEMCLGAPTDVAAAEGRAPEEPEVMLTVKESSLPLPLRPPLPVYAMAGRPCSNAIWTASTFSPRCFGDITSALPSYEAFPRSEATTPLQDEGAAPSPGSESFGIPYDDSSTPLWDEETTSSCGATWGSAASSPQLDERGSPFLLQEDGLPPTY